MSMITGIAHIAVTVKNMDRAIDFYTRVLRFKKVFEIPDPKTGAPWINYLYIGRGQFLELFYDGKKENPWAEDLRGFNHLCLLVDDLHAVVGEIKQAGGIITDGPKQGSDHNWQAWTEDPDGIRIELMQIDKNSPHYRVIQENK
ncbi:MAG: VOC family protein [Spirochaetaceae bacterium]|nr:VOC family protein [Spirochaetaceae bacterium]